jgi:membrane protein insertase Oxa1/YidC/SpoIIIJ
MKKGFVFSFDSFLALTIFVLFIILIYFFFISSTPATQQYYFSEDMLNVMSNVKIDELNLERYPEIKTLVQDNKINPSSTIMEELITLKLKVIDDFYGKTK